MARVMTLLPVQVLASVGGDGAAREQFLHLGVVARELRDLARPHDVDAAVAGPDAGVIAVEGEQHRERRADHGAAAVRG